MGNVATAWKTDNYKFVGKEFDYSYVDFLSKQGIMSLIGSELTNSIDYEITGMDGYGELQPYDGTNLVHGTPKRGFKTIITPKEFNLTRDLGMKQVKVDRTGQSNKTGKYLGRSAAITRYLYALRMIARAYDSNYVGGDGKKWAATDHPIASKYSEGRGYIADADAGTFSNLFTGKLGTKTIDDMRRAGRDYVAPTGLPMALKHDMLLVSSKLEAQAASLLGRGRQYRPMKDPESAENAASTISDMQWMVVGDGKDGLQGEQFAICDSTMLKEVALVVDITPPKVMETELDNPLIQRFVAYADFGYGFGDARPIIFSTGAGA